jgi:hypothetical protein
MKIKIGSWLMLHEDITLSRGMGSVFKTLAGEATMVRPELRWQKY